MISWPRFSKPSFTSGSDSAKAFMPAGLRTNNREFDKSQNALGLVSHCHRCKQLLRMKSPCQFRILRMFRIHQPQKGKFNPCVSVKGAWTPNCWMGKKKTKGMGAPFQGSVPKWHREVVFDPSSDVIEAGWGFFSQPNNIKSSLNPLVGPYTSTLKKGHSIDKTAQAFF